MNSQHTHKVPTVILIKKTGLNVHAGSKIFNKQIQIQL